MEITDIIKSNKNIITFIQDKDCKIVEYEKIPKYFIIDKLKYNNKKFNYIQKINDYEINIFTSIFSIPFQKTIHLTIINWLNSKINNDIFCTFSNSLNQPGIAINDSEFINMCDTKSNYARSLDTTNKILPSTKKYKIHINIKLEFLFWSIEHIINNAKKFIIKINNIKKPLFSFLKIHTDFHNFTTLRETNSILDNEKILYSPNIVFYQYKDTDDEITKICFQKLVKVLLKLFPNNLNISSKIYSKYSLKLNNNIYLQTGDAIDKKNKSSEYTIPIEYTQILDSCTKKKNDLVKKLSNHQLCKFVDNKWIPNDLSSIYYLVPKDNNSINNIMADIGLKPLFYL